jgi:rhamnogalacturonyl hydrolase YesR
VPRWSNGAISHRENVAELWADFVYMVPPFLAYTGVATCNVTLLKEAATQAKLYRDVMIQPAGVWMHITGPEVQDYELWSTGNGWAAAGMARVLATLKKSRYAAETKAEQASLTGLIKEILDGVRALDTDESGLLRNYLNQTSWFGEISGTSILAATALRVAVLEPETFGQEYTDWAVAKKDVVDGHINAEEGDNKGIVTPAVNPLNWWDETPYTTGSPEGQSFVVLLHAAFRDWKKGKKGKNGSG